MVDTVTIADSPPVDIVATTPAPVDVPVADQSGTVTISQSGLTVPPPGGTNPFLSLTDVPGSYVGSGGLVVAVKATEDGLEFIPVAGTGTVTSVGLALPTVLYNVTGTPVTAAGTLTAALKTQLVNVVFAGPASGGAATPTFRALVAADIPSLAGVYATAAQGALAASAVQPGSLAAVATSGAASDITSGTFADARVASSNVTQHQALLSINWTQLTGTIPPLVITSVQTATSDATQLALTTEQGDIVIRTDLNKTYVRNAGVAGTMADFNEVLSPLAAVSSVFGRAGAITANTGDYNLDQISDGTTNKAYTTTEKTKLGGIAAGATANSSDATLEARANHTGTQLASTISDFATAADARVKVGISAISLQSKSAAYTTVLADAGTAIFHPAADTTARTFTIDSNANVAYPVGTVLTFINQNAGGVITIAITADTLRLAGAGTTGSRTLAANGIATATKIATTEWIISGTGLT